MNHICRTHHGTQLFYSPSTPEYEESVLLYAAGAYGFLLPTNRGVTLAGFADLIEKSYSMDNPKNAEVCRVLRSNS